MVKRYWRCTTLAAAAVLGGCTTQLYWVKLDGTWIADKPALLRQLETDKTICKGRAAGSRLDGSPSIVEPSIKLGPSSSWSSTSATFENVSRTADQAADSAAVFDGCMAERGYRRAPGRPGGSD